MAVGEALAIRSATRFASFAKSAFATTRVTKPKS